MTTGRDDTMDGGTEDNDDNWHVAGRTDEQMTTTAADGLDGHKTNKIIIIGSELCIGTMHYTDLP